MTKKLVDSRWRLAAIILFVGGTVQWLFYIFLLARCH